MMPVRLVHDGCKKFKIVVNDRDKIFRKLMVEFMFSF